MTRRQSVFALTALAAGIAGTRTVEGQQTTTGMLSMSDLNPPYSIDVDLTRVTALVVTLGGERVSFTAAELFAALAPKEDTRE